MTNESCSSEHELQAIVRGILSAGFLEVCTMLRERGARVVEMSLVHSSWAAEVTVEDFPVIFGLDLVASHPQRGRPSESPLRIPDRAILEEAVTRVWEIGTGQGVSESLVQSAFGWYVLQAITRAQSCCCLLVGCHGSREPHGFGAKDPFPLPFEFSVGSSALDEFIEFSLVATARRSQGRVT